MAKALVCNDCKKLLKNVAEAQAHNEITGHANFEETTEAIKIMKCTTCGKPCRTDAERGLHTRYTGHSSFEDATDEAPVLNTEQEMRQARDDMEEDDDLLRTALGKKKKKDSDAAAPGSTAGAAAESSGAGVEGEAAAQAEGSEEKFEPEVDQALLNELMADMGFPRNRAIRAIYFSHATDAGAAINWLVDHDTETDIDLPLLVTKESEAAREKLSPEEAKKKAEDLVRKARERREREEREAEVLREKERIRAGKEMLKAKQMEDELALKRMIEQRQREKEEDARAREALRKRLEEDRKERRRKLGLPEELTEEEKAREAEKAREVAKKEAEAKKIFNVVRPVTAIEKLRTQLVNAKKTATAAGPSEDAAFKVAVQTMAKYIGNVAANPEEPKFRYIKLANAAFQSRVAAVPGCIDFLQTCGFHNDGEALAMSREAVNSELLAAAIGLLNDAVSNPFFGVL